MKTFLTTSSAQFLRRPLIGVFAATAMLFGSLVFGAHVDNGNGNILFTATQSDVSVDGEFRKFTADVDFNPAKPDAGKVALAIDMASVTTGSSDADDLLKEPDFFDVKHFPRATFTSRTISPSGTARFQVRGDFSLKGRSAELIMQFTARPEAGGLRIEGSFPISRSAYRVGEGQWADTGTLADQVQIRFSLNVQR